MEDEAARPQSGALGAELRRRRASLKILQGDLAEQLGVKQQTVSRWEQGYRPDAQYFQRIAEFLGVSMEQVVRLVYFDAGSESLADRVETLERRIEELTRQLGARRSPER